MNFTSDTSAPAHPAVLEALSRVNDGPAPSYGADEASARAKAALVEIFETELEVWLCGSGTASNALSLSLLCPPTSAILCHAESHISCDERGAVEFFTGGGKLSLLPGEHARIDAAALEAAIGAIKRDFVHETPADVLSLTNLTESGAAYSLDQLSAHIDRAKAAGLSVHLDGARFANALVTLGCTPAQASWRLGVDVLTFGATKNGGLGCEAIILFGDMRARLPELHARAKRAGHMPAKMRFLAAQLEAYLQDGLWLELARAANAAAARLADGLARIPGASLAHPIDGNEVFAFLPQETAEAMLAAGASFYPWLDGSYRFVCAWNTQEADVEALLDAARERA